MGENFEQQNPGIDGTAWGARDLEQTHTHTHTRTHLFILLRKE